jgi:hypothetical protein
MSNGYIIDKEKFLLTIITGIALRMSLTFSELQKPCKKSTAR